MSLRFLLTPVVFGIVLVVGFRALDARAPATASVPKAQPVASVVATPAAATPAAAPDASRSGPRNVLVQPALETSKPLLPPPAMPTIGPQPTVSASRSTPGPAAEPMPNVASVEPAATPVAEAQPQPSVAQTGGRGSLGCTTYKSYNPQTRTYRGYDGVVKECKARPDATASN